jgi:hypothetical protein
LWTTRSSMASKWWQVCNKNAPLPRYPAINWMQLRRSDHSLKSAKQWQQ